MRTTFPVLALAVSPSATQWRPDLAGPAASPSAERAAMRQLLTGPNRPRRVVMVHTAAARPAAEQLADQEGVVDQTVFVLVRGDDPVRVIADRIAARVRDAVAAVGDGRPLGAAAVVEVSAGPPQVSVAGLLAAEMLGCPAHVRSVPQLTGVAGVTVDDSSRAKSTLLHRGRGSKPTRARTIAAARLARRLTVRSFF